MVTIIVFILELYWTRLDKYLKLFVIKVKNAWNHESNTNLKVSRIETCDQNINPDNIFGASLSIMNVDLESKGSTSTDEDLVKASNMETKSIRKAEFHKAFADDISKIYKLEPANLVSESKNLINISTTESNSSNNAAKYKNSNSLTVLTIEVEFHRAFEDDTSSVESEPTTSPDIGKIKNAEKLVNSAKNSKTEVHRTFDDDIAEIFF